MADFGPHNKTNYFNSLKRNEKFASDVVQGEAQSSDNQWNMQLTECSSGIGQQ